ncbi:hypothetical protein DFQ04_3074 [Algoriphagus boseongensis]|uniref:Uncharacterized protein n=1 Tax=Algoriphagus boseongensis TaxID=1442587 RepID=A0A4R6T343_9BACT|nr:hypothetical protein [Algoriphagus boseongensis]TDQ15188.1 hypothetical protein DFQ04_3074 [Algoriphagus boseongensis]
MIDKNKKIDFFDDFTLEYFSRGFSNMPKRDLDVLIFHLLEKHGAFKGMSNYDIARFLRTTPTKVKSAKYESVLRFDYKDFEKGDYLKSALREYFKKPLLHFDNNYLYMQIENPVLMDALKGKLKEGGLFFDGSFNSEVIKMTSEGYTKFIKKIALDDLGSKSSKKAIKEFEKLDGKTVSEVSEKIFEVAKEKILEKSIDEGFEIIKDQTFNFFSENFESISEFVKPFFE